MFSYFKVQSEPDTVRGTSRFVISMLDHGKKVSCSKIISNDELLIEGYVDILFRNFLDYFKSQLSKVEKQRESPKTKPSGFGHDENLSHLNTEGSQ